MKQNEVQADSVQADFPEKPLCIFSRIIPNRKEIVVALILGGVIGTLCADIAPLSWLNYGPPLHIKTREWNWYIADVTFGLHSKFNIAQLILTIVAIFTAPKVAALIGKK